MNAAKIHVARKSMIFMATHANGFKVCLVRNAVCTVMQYADIASCNAFYMCVRVWYVCVCVCARAPVCVCVCVCVCGICVCGNSV